MSAAMEAMKAARKARGKIPAHLKARQKKQRLYQKTITKALSDGPKTVPELAEETGLDSHDLFWHINALRKYGFVEIHAEEDEYLSYALVAE